MWSPVEKCWVPTCSNSKDNGYKKNFFPLPGSLKYKEIWLALSRKSTSGSEVDIVFCQDHFEPSTVEVFMERFVCLTAEAVPYYNMPEKICRTCMCVIGEGDVFCVLSAVVPSAIPPDIKSDVLTCRAEPLMQLLNFCVPELNLTQDPPPITCFKCYHNIWLFYIYKLTCNAVEKSLRKNLSPAEYGKAVLCRSCPASSGTSFFNLKEESPMGSLLKKMFLSNYATDVVPLKLCLKCWNILFKLERFYAQCLSVEGKLHQHFVINQTVLNNTIHQPTTGMPLPPSYKDSVNVLREFRKMGHPYQKPAQASSTSNAQTSQFDSHPATVTSTSVTKFHSKQNESFDANGMKLEYKPNASLLHTLRNMETQLVASQSVQPILTQVPGIKLSEQSRVLNVDEYTEDENDRSLSPKKLLGPTQKIALAEIMLRHGGPLKSEGDMQKQLGTWMHIVIELFKSGHNCNLDDVQYTWECMKNSAKRALKTIGPAMFGDQLVIEYLFGDCRAKNLQASTEYNAAKKIGDCEVICIDDDDDDDNVKDNKVKDNKVDNSAKVAKRVTPMPSKPAKKGRPAGGHKKREAEKGLNKTTNNKKRGRPVIWNQDQNLKLVRSMRREYDKCLKNNELFPAKSPWKMILERVSKKAYAHVGFSKLYTVWGKIKMSATIHEKNGLDIVDEEVWDMLQMQNAILKSVVAKNCTLNGNNEAEPVKLEQNGTKGPSTRNADKAKKGALQTQLPTTSQAEKSCSEAKDCTAQIKQKPPKTKQGEDGAKGKRKMYHCWTESEKIELFKMIKKEFNVMLKKGENMSNPWMKLADRIYENGYKDVPSSTIHSAWTTMRRNACLHENTGNRSILDDKVTRLLKLYNRVKSTKASPQLKVPAVRETKKAADTVKVAESVDDQRTGSFDVEDEGDNTKSFRWPHDLKMDLISTIISYGDEVFKTNESKIESTFWQKVTTHFNAKGYDKNVNQVKGCWQYAMTSAKLAWADQKTASTYDKVIIDFMTNVIQNKSKNEEEFKEEYGEAAVCEEEGDQSKNGEAFKEEDGEATMHEEEDDHFDEVSERMSDNSKSPSGSTTEEASEGEGLNYDYVSLEDIENNYGMDDVRVKKEEPGGIKKEEPEEMDEPLPFKIESYSSAEVIEIVESEDD